MGDNSPLEMESASAQGKVVTKDVWRKSLSEFNTPSRTRRGLLNSHCVSLGLLLLPA